MRRRRINLKDSRDCVQGYFCSKCQTYHHDLPLSFGADRPEHWYHMAPEERERRSFRNDDQCIIDGKYFFVRGCIEIPVIDADEVFTWGVWVSLSQSNFERASKLWYSEDREKEEPYFGWLSTSIELYPETLNLKTLVHTRTVRQRPLVELEPTDHPLSMEQRMGITMQRVYEIAERLGCCNE